MIVCAGLTKVAVQAVRRPYDIGLMDTSRVRLRVWPNDLDFNFHVNNGRYLTLMDIGRFDYLLRTGLAGVMVKRRWSPILAASTIRHRRALGPFERFKLETRIIWWDDKWIYFDQRFINSTGRAAAHGLVRVCLRAKGEALPTGEILDAIGQNHVAPANPPHLADWLKTLEQMAELTRKPVGV